jgi:hypothetical protein
MCWLCASSEDDQETASREQILSLLALLEHPTALCPEQTLRLGGQLLASLGSRGSLRCEAVAPAAATPIQLERRIIR